MYKIKISAIFRTDIPPHPSLSPENVGESKREEASPVFIDEK